LQVQLLPSAWEFAGIKISATAGPTKPSDSNKKRRIFLFIATILGVGYEG
jgi:hypothetical protein